MTESTDSEGGYELRHYLQVLWRRRLSIIGPMVLLALVGWLLGSGLTVTHASRAEILTKPIETGAVATSGRDSSAVGDEIAILRSDEIRTTVEDRVGHEVTIDVTQESADSNVLTLLVTGEQEEVQADAQAYVDAYVEVRRAELARGARAATEALTTRLDDVNAQLSELSATITDLYAQIVAEPDETALRGLNAQLEDQQALRASLSLRQSDIRSQLDDLELSTAVTPTQGIEVLSNASEPQKIEGATRTQYATAGLALGLVLGVLLAFAREHFDQSVRTTRDLELATKGVRVLGAIPRHPRGATQ